ncbi:MAG: ERF family protein, partial [Candidatus Uhrbacteria bacterium]|nr:ERF family protein [Candidatus Uhrbacteria bacterium]
IGSALTYAKRYNLVGLLAIPVGGDDDDGASDRRAYDEAENTERAAAEERARLLDEHRAAYDALREATKVAATRLRTTSADVIDRATGGKLNIDVLSVTPTKHILLAIERVQALQ